MPEAAASDLLRRIHVVLVQPQGPRNVGAAARAMLNFGLTNLRLVGGCDPLHQESRMMAVKALPLLEAAQRSTDLDQALAGLTCVVGTTARRRDRLPVLTPREAAPRILEQAAEGAVGLLFGQEDHGLDGDALRLAHHVIAIDTSPACRALNLAQAVLLIAYEIHLACATRERAVGSDPGRLVTADMGTRLKLELARALEVLGIIHDGTRLAHTRSLERLLSLGPMQTRDARVLFAMARRINKLAAELLPFRGLRLADPEDGAGEVADTDLTPAP